GSWYVVGKDQERGEPRAFRLSRIRSDIEVLEGTYDIPGDFDAGAHVGGAAFEVGTEVVTGTIRFSPDLRWWAEQNMSGAPITERPEGALDVEVPVGNPSALISWVIGFGGGVEIVSPPAARQALLDHLAPFVAETA
ncbi:MAG: WYL domain-containing protein, partial [Actinobacteria bacterium]|nr:WYL domain-containing protein [Actinomycetota bacterium]